MVAAYPAIAHDHDPIGNRKDLGEAVGNEDDGNAACPEGAQLVEKAQGFTLRQRRRRLI